MDGKLPYTDASSVRGPARLQDMGAERGVGAGSSGDILQITPILLLNRHGICDFPCSLDPPPLISPRDTSLCILIEQRGVSNDGPIRAYRARLGQANPLICRARHAATSLDPLFTPSMLTADKQADELSLLSVSVPEVKTPVR